MALYVAGDREAFREIFRRYAPVLSGVLRQDVSRQEEVRDLVQQTFLHLHRARRDFKQGARLRPWLFTIALNVKREYFRKMARRREAPGGLDVAPEAPVRTNPGQERATARVRDALTRLPAPQREVIVLHWFEGLSFAEIAEIVGARLSAVKVRAHRGYALLRAWLSEPG